MDVTVWAILFAVFVVVELVTVQLVSIWFAFGSLVTLICTYFFDIPVLGQLAVFIAVSAVSLIVTVPFLRKKLNSSKIATNSELDIGKSATVIEEINTDLGTGRVSLNGVNWGAVPADKATVIPKGSIVTVAEIDGAKLVVTPKSTVTAEKN